MPDNSQLIGEQTALAGSKITSQGGKVNSATAGGGSSGTVAYVASGAQVRAEDDVAIRARDELDYFGLAGNVAAGLVALGASVVVANVDSNVEAYIAGGASVSAGPDAGYDLLVWSDLTSNMDGRAYAGQAGFVSVGAQVVVLNDNSTVWAHVNDGAILPRACGTVTIEASSTRNVSTHWSAAPSAPWLSAPQSRSPSRAATPRHWPATSTWETAARTWATSTC